LVYERHDRNNKISQNQVIVCDVREQCCRPLRTSATNLIMILSVITHCRDVLLD
jgi:hypothetical protein